MSDRFHVAGAIGPRLLLCFCLVLFASGGAYAAGWVLDPAQSTLTYQSVKKNTVVETNTIRNITGEISPDGDARIEFDLNSVDTGVDLRNVRMRFLFFETFQYPTATVTAKVDPAAFADLATSRRMIAPLTVTLSLHGVEKDFSTKVAVTMVTDSLVSVASQAPVVGQRWRISACCRRSRSWSAPPTSPTSCRPLRCRSISSSRATKVEHKPAAVQVAATAADGADRDRRDQGRIYQPEECAQPVRRVCRAPERSISDPAAPSLDPASKPGARQRAGCGDQMPGAENTGRRAIRIRDGSDVANQTPVGAASQIGDGLYRPGRSRSRQDRVRSAMANPDRSGPNDTEKNKALNRRIEFSASANRTIDACW
jgi:OOP family OmpA-OmpF porin